LLGLRTPKTSTKLEEIEGQEESDTALLYHFDIPKGRLVGKGGRSMWKGAGPAAVPCCVAGMAVAEQHLNLLDSACHARPWHTGTRGIPPVFQRPQPSSSHPIQLRPQPVLLWTSVHTMGIIFQSSK